MKGTISSIIIGLAIVVSTFILSNAYINRNSSNNSISVTGLGESDFVSDLIVWEGDFSKENLSLKQAYSDLEKDRQLILVYVKGKGIDSEQIVFSAVTTKEISKIKYSNEGQYIGEDFIGYMLSQKIQIESKEVEKVEKISREITELLNKGIQLYSSQPRYYYTKLADLKIEMISKATTDAKLRADNIAKNSEAFLGELTSAKMGIFQITGQNSEEDYSWGGTLNTSSKLKTASITVKLKYRVNN